MERCHVLPMVAGAAMLLLGSVQADEQKDFFKPKDPTPVVSGKSEVLRHIPKKFATFESVDPAKRQVTLLLEGEKEAKTWNVNPDVEVKFHGWWGRLDQLVKGDRVWIWFDVDRKKQPKSILMIADEISQQDIHGKPYTVQKVSNLGFDTIKKRITWQLELKSSKGESKVFRRELDLPREALGNADALVVDIELPKPGTPVFIQTNGEELRTMVGAEELEKLRREQKVALSKRWLHEGLPGMVSFLHALGGEMDFILDHEAIRWGRSLKTGDKVTLKTSDPIQAVVKDVRPWRERTLLRLVVPGFDQADLTVGQRVHLHMAAPPKEVDESEYPPDIGRPRTKTERVEWFLASTYCSCKVRGDTCTGMFYTLASCNVNACGMPNHIRELVGGMIDKGLSDKEIWDELKKSQGPLMLKPHLLAL